MQYKSDNWTHEESLKHCELQALPKLEKQLASCVQEDKIAIIAKRILKSVIRDIQGNAEQDDESQYEESINQILDYPAVRNIAAQYRLQLKHAWERRVRELQYAYSPFMYKHNRKKIAQLGDEPYFEAQKDGAYCPPSKERPIRTDRGDLLNHDSGVAIKSTFPLELANNPDNPGYKYPTPDYAGTLVSEKIRLDASWEHRIPELLVLTTQKLASELYKQFPEESKGENQNKHKGVNLTLVFTHKDTVYTAWVGHNPAVVFNKGRRNRTTITPLTTPSNRCLGKTHVEGSNDIVHISVTKLPRNHSAVVLAGSPSLFKNTPLATLKPIYRQHADDPVAVAKHCHNRAWENETLGNITAVAQKTGLIYIADDGTREGTMAKYVHNNLAETFLALAQKPAPKASQQHKAKGALSLIKKEMKHEHLFHPTWLSQKLDPQSAKNTATWKRTEHHITTTTKNALDIINPPQANGGEEAPQRDQTKILEDVADIFSKSSKKNITFFRSSNAKIFYQAFSNPLSAMAARDALEKVHNEFVEKAKVKDLLIHHGGTKIAIKIDDVEPIFPRNAAKIVTLFQQASKYKITWQDAITEAEDILSRRYCFNMEHKPKNRTAATQKAYNEMFNLIQQKYRSQLATSLTEDPDFQDDDRFTTTFLKYTPPKSGTQWYSKLPGMESKIKGLYEELAKLNWHQGALQDEEYQHIKLQALQWLAYNLFKAAEDISFCKRNGSNLYNHLMSKIADCLGMEISGKNSAEIVRNTRVNVERFMHRNEKLMEVRARVFENTLKSQLPEEPLKSFQAKQAERLSV